MMTPSVVGLADGEDKATAVLTPASSVRTSHQTVMSINPHAQNTSSIL